MFFHLGFQKLARLGVERAQAVLVHQHGLVAEPRLSRLLRDVLEDALAEFAGISRVIESLGLFAELDALHHAGHQAFSSCCSSFRTGAARPRASGRATLYQTLSPFSIAHSQFPVVRAGMGVMSR